MAMERFISIRFVLIIATIQVIVVSLVFDCYNNRPVKVRLK